jgi:glutamate formiminotransferase
MQTALNFSEGRRVEVVEALIDAVASSGVRILSTVPSAADNRTVVTCLGSPEQLYEAVLRGAQAAVRLIDLNQHRGDYPRMGAIDAIPISPITGCTLQGCVVLARLLGEALAERLALPVFLYEAAASRPERSSLAAIRRSGFEELRDLIGVDSAYSPDFGPSQVHPSAGCTAVGARMPTILLGVRLEAENLAIQDRFARSVEMMSEGRLRPVSPPEPGGLLSFALQDYQQLPLHRACALLRSEALRLGRRVVTIAPMGPLPLEAVLAVARYYLEMGELHPEHVWESHLMG